MEHRYWDSDCFLGWLQAEPDKEFLCKRVLEEARAGNITIVTSALTLAEVLATKGQSPIPSANRLLVERFFKHEFIIVRGVTRRIAEMARELVWDRSIAPKDAIHVATALEAKLPLFNTFDLKLIAKTKTLGDPQLVVERPSIVQARLPIPMFDEDQDRLV